MPRIVLISVDFPAPFVPIMAVLVLLLNEKLFIFKAFLNMVFGRMLMLEIIKSPYMEMI